MTTPQLFDDPLATIPTDLPYSDGVPMDSPRHRSQMELLIQTLEDRWRERDDFFCGGNMFIHYSPEQVRNRDFLGPDFFVVLDTDHSRERRYWAPWDENLRMPNVIVELLSPTTENEDRTTKKVIYERSFRTPEYYLYEPDSRTIEGFRLSDRRYRPIPVEDGRLWSEELDCWLGLWEGEFHQIGTWMRFYERNGSLVLLASEREAQRANAETQRANTAEAELARLKAELERLRSGS